MEFQWNIAVLGFTAGILIGLTGMGGGSIMSPLLILLLGIRASVAVGTDLVQMTVTKAFGAWQHHRQGTIDYPLALRLALGSVPGALSGVLLLGFLRDSGVDIDTLITRLLGIAVLPAALYLLAAQLFPQRKIVPTTLWKGKRSGPFLLYILSSLGGLTVGITSVGSGFIFVLLLLALLGIPIRRVVGTDIFHATLLVAPAGLAHWATGNVDPVLASNILLGSVPGVLLGSRLAVQLPVKGLRALIGIMLFVTGIRLLI